MHDLRQLTVNLTVILVKHVMIFFSTLSRHDALKNLHSLSFQLVY